MTSEEADGSPPMTERAMRIDLIKASIERDEYAVDPRAVADAIVALLLRRQNACS
jgi:anti-sigma28 factor (negative regulator of flagellin synthesis)